MICGLRKHVILSCWKREKKSDDVRSQTTWLKGSGRGFATGWCQDGVRWASLTKLQKQRPKPLPNTRNTGQELQETTWPKGWFLPWSKQPDDLAAFVEAAWTMWSSEGISCTEQCCSPALLQTLERFECCQSLQEVVLLRSSPDLSNKCLPVATACLAGRTRTLDYECNMRGFTLFYINVYPLYLHLWLVSLFYIFGLLSLFVWLVFIISIFYSKLWPNYQL